MSGLPKTVVLTAEEVRRALEEPVAQIIDAIKSTLDKTPPELAADIIDHGRPRRWRRAPDGPRRAPPPRDPHAGPSGREPAHLRGRGSGRSLEEFEVIHRLELCARATLPPAASRPPSALIGDLVPRNRTARLAVLGRPASCRAVSLPSPQRYQAPRGVGVPRRALARAPHDLLPRVERRAAHGPGRRRNRSAPVPGGRGPRCEPFDDPYWWFDGLLTAKAENEKLRRRTNGSSSRRSRTRPRPQEDLDLKEFSRYQDLPGLEDYRAVKTRVLGEQPSSASDPDRRRPATASA